MPTIVENPVISVNAISHYYGDRRALNDVSFDVKRGEAFCFLGPNGGGKTTMFKILSTLLVPSSGTARVCGFDVVRDPAKVRRRIGVVFQSPSLDLKLTVKENLRCHGLMYGLRGSEAMRKIDEALSNLGLDDRRNEPVERLSGGLQRRVEIGKGLLSSPDLLILDEPSTGLDPGARIDLWDYLLRLRKELTLTIAMTSHILSEAEHCDRLAILDKGSLVALDTPLRLKREVGGEVISIVAKKPEEIKLLIKKRFKLDATVVENTLRFEKRNGHQFVPKIIEAFPGKIDAVSVGQPTLEDVFIHRTGHRMRDEHPNGSDE